jgi:microcystin-dependent protein
MYGYVVGITGAGYASVELNDIVHFKNASDPWQGSGPYAQGSNDDIRAVVVALPTASVRYLQLSVIPKYTGGRFTYQNAILKTGNAANANANYRIWQANGQPRSATTFTVTEVAMLHFRTPDLRGRFALGSNSVGLSDNAIETEPTFISSLGIYSMGSLGGEEAHALTNTELPSHTHTATDGGHSHLWTGFVSVEPGNNGQLYDFEFAAAMRSRGVWVGGSTTTPNTVDGRVPASLPNGVLSPQRIGELQESGAGGGEDRDSGVGAYNVASSSSNISVGNTGANSPHNNMPPYTTVLYIIKAKPYTRAAIIDGVDIPYSSLLVRDLRSRNVSGIAGDQDLVICTNKATDSGNGTERIRVKGGDGKIGIGTISPISELDVNGTGIFTKVGVGVSSVPTVALDVNGITRFTGSVGVNTASPSVALDIVGEARSSISTTATSNAKTLVTKDYLQSFTRIGSVVMGVLTQGQTSNIFGNSVQCTIRTTNDTVTITFPTGTSWSGFAARNSDGGAFGGSANGPGFAGLTTFTNANSFTATGVTESNTRVILFAIRTV